MSKFVKLLTSARVNGVLRHPHEGTLHLDDDEAQRLIYNGAGEDVTDGFSADQKKEAPVETLDANRTPATGLKPVEHQADAPAPQGEIAKPKKETAK